MKNPKNMTEVDLVDLIYQVDPALYATLVAGEKIKASRKKLIAIVREQYNLN